MAKVAVTCLAVFLIVGLLVGVGGCTGLEPATEENLKSVVDSGDFYVEEVSETLVYIYLEGTHSPSLQMMYVTEQLEILDRDHKIVDVALAIYRQWVWSPVIVVLGEK